MKFILIGSPVDVVREAMRWHQREELKVEFLEKDIVLIFCIL
jgi:hypothetical protein